MRLLITAFVLGWVKKNKKNQGAVGGVFSKASRSGVPTSVHAPEYSAALTRPLCMAVRNSGANAALWPAGVPANIAGRYKPTVL
jgi:hypothetical protein